MTRNTTPSPDRGLAGLLAEFLRLESAGGLVLMAAAVLAMIVANSPLTEAYQNLLALPFRISLGEAGLHKPLILWINDGLMAVFFLLVGLELKREMVVGHLSSLRKASLPAIAALGGMAVPALVFVLFNRGDTVALRGWAVPTATDIAFALGVLALLGNRVPAALKAFLLSIAIFDDLGAVIVIALFYTAELSGLALGIAGLCVLGLWLLNRLGVTRPAAYILLGISLWVAVLKSGVHATLAGVVLAMFIPLRDPKHPEHSPSGHLEHILHPWVAFGVLPVFAFANAGVPLAGFGPADVAHPVPLGIMAGLFLGKQLGVLGFSWLGVRLGLAQLPGEVGWKALHGTALLCGVGFTMSLFIASLAFGESQVEWLGLERLGILLGSLVSGICGYLVLHRCLGPGDPAASSTRP